MRPLLPLRFVSLFLPKAFENNIFHTVTMNPPSNRTAFFSNAAEMVPLVKFAALCGL